ncbi:MAG: thiamine diphosphokinase [Oscillospiraceae bacterium]|jgi:thiamine pyrophosphokinase|nr:thiamine diphosphokinase [Oscillospiraceae bacterium]
MRETSVSFGTCYIVGAAPQANEIYPTREDFVVAADGGCAHLRRWGRTPDFVVGDLDSLEGAPPSGVPCRRFPTKKDNTDTALALQEGFARGYRRFELVGCTAGRPDHTFANQQLLLWAARQGAFACLRGEGCRATALVGGGELRLRGQGTVSVFAFDGAAEGVTIKGMCYPLNNETLWGDTPRGISNQLDGEGYVALQSGALLVFWEDTIEPLANI